VRIFGRGIFRLSPPSGFWIFSAGEIAGLIALTIFLWFFTKGGARNLSILISVGILILSVYLLILATSLDLSENGRWISGSESSPVCS